MRRRFAGVAHELLAVGADGDEEAVDAHRSARVALGTRQLFYSVENARTHPDSISMWLR